MKQQIDGDHWDDESGNSAGGTTTGRGIQIVWQAGPLGRDGDRQEPNGAFVEGVIQAAIDRLEYYQRSRFNCATNARAIDALRLALACLEDRTASREARKVEGTHAE